MTKTLTYSLFSAVLLFLAPLSGSVSASSWGAAPASVKFTKPANGAKVSPKFKVAFEAIGMGIKPAGDLTPGTGHHHLIIDGKPIAKGEVVPADATHIHFGKGQTETEVELTAGKHTLTLQFADGTHKSFGPEMSATIEVTVK